MTTAPAAGTMLGRYQVLKPLARGGMAEVLLARAIGLKGFERHVVIKRIRVEKGSDQKTIDMFLDEARLAGSLHHRNIVQVHDVGEEEGKYFFVMEYVHGRDARELLRMVKDKRAQIPLEHVITIATAAAAGLHYAHEQRGPDRQPLGIVHRDVSPGNILLAFDGGVKVVDFGIAKAHVRSADTQAGEMKGKVGYMSPEQCRAEPIDRRTDVFLLGIVLYELVTVRRLFKFDTRYETMTAIVDREITPPSKYRKDLPAELEQIILKALAKSPADRYPTADALRLALESFATRAGLTLSASRLSDYLKELYGDVPEPWLVDERPPTPDPERLQRASQASFAGAMPAPATGPVEKAAFDVAAPAHAESAAPDAAAAPTSDAATASSSDAAPSDAPAVPDATAAPTSDTATASSSDGPATPDAASAPTTPSAVAETPSATTTPAETPSATSAKPIAAAPPRSSQPTPMAWPIDPRSERRRKAWLIGIGIAAAGGLAFLATAFLGTNDASIAAPPSAVAPAARADAAIAPPAEARPAAATEDAGATGEVVNAGAAQPVTTSDPSGAAGASAATDATKADIQPAHDTGAPADGGSEPASASTASKADTKDPVRKPPKRPRRPVHRKPVTPARPAEPHEPAASSPPGASAPAATPASPPTPDSPPPAVRATPTDDGPPAPPVEAAPTTAR